jgi:hypothetical protein
MLLFCLVSQRLLLLGRAYRGGQVAFEYNGLRNVSIGETGGQKNGQTSGQATEQNTEQKTEKKTELLKGRVIGGYKK